MTAKEYLSQYGEIQQRIADRLEEIKNINDLRYNATSSLNPTGGAGNSATGKMARLLALFMELEEIVVREVEQLVAKRREIERVISGIKDEQLKALLEKKYIQLKSLEKISVEMGYSYRQIRRLHGQALTLIRCP